MSEANGHEELSEAEARLREVREAVADQLHDLVIERTGIGSKDELGRRVQLVVEARRRVLEAQGRQAQAQTFGNPVAPHMKAEREALELLRQTVMSLAEACGSYVVALDFEPIRPRVGSSA